MYSLAYNCGERRQRRCQPTGDTTSGDKITPAETNLNIVRYIAQKEMTSGCINTLTKLSPANNSKRLDSTPSMSTRTDITDSPSRKSLPPDETNMESKPDSSPQMPGTWNGKRKVPESNSKNANPMSGCTLLNSMVKQKNSSDTITQFIQTRDRVIGAMIEQRG